ncbi:MAG TPA: hypothetical protein VF520_13495 [Thermoleophilaceae bacterium]
MSEFEDPGRLGREPTVEDVRALVGPSTPHFALQIRNRIRNLIAGLPDGHPARVEGERHVERLERIAFEGERRGPAVEGERELPSVRRPGDAGEPAGGPPPVEPAGRRGHP